jgi:hypothetical protein
MATLTYDPTEAQDGEFSADELDSLKVGEALEEQQNQLLAGKFKDAEDLEQAYIELQRKLGNREPEQVEEQAEPEQEEDAPEEIDNDFLEILWQESQDEYSQETIEALQNMDPTDLAQMYLDYRSQVEEGGKAETISDADVQTLQGIVGGQEQYSQMMAWAQDNLSEQEISMYDSVMDRGDPLACYFAVNALAFRFQEAQGYDGQMLTGKAPSSQQQGFRSQAELVRAMSDPRYDSDPAYRADVAAKLEMSDLNF